MVGSYELSQSLVPADRSGVLDCCVLPSRSDVPGSDESTPTPVPYSFRIVLATRDNQLWEFCLPSGASNSIGYQHVSPISALLSSYDHDRRGSHDDEELYLTGSDDAVIRVFNGWTHKEITTLVGHTQAVSCLSWALGNSSDTRYLVSGSSDGTARIWDVSRAAMVATVRTQSPWVCAVGIDIPGVDLFFPKSKESLIAVVLASESNDRKNALQTFSVNITSGQTDLHSSIHVANDTTRIRDICVMRTTEAATPVAAFCSEISPLTLVFLGNPGGPSMTSPVDTTQLKQGKSFLSIASVSERSSRQSSSLVVSSSTDGQVVLATLSGDLTIQGEPEVFQHSACVWKVRSLPHGAFATCCDDGILRIFARSTERYEGELRQTKFRRTFTREDTRKQSNGTSQETEPQEIDENILPQQIARSRDDDRDLPVLQESRIRKRASASTPGLAALRAHQNNRVVGLKNYAIGRSERRRPRSVSRGSVKGFLSIEEKEEKVRKGEITNQFRLFYLGNVGALKVILVYMGK
jgi:WD40 repeat protein